MKKLSAKNFFTWSFFSLGEEYLHREFSLRRELFFYSRRRALRRELKVWLSPKSIPLGEDSVSRSGRLSMVGMYTYDGNGGFRMSRECLVLSLFYS
jgi:hypothetical protein